MTRLEEIERQLNSASRGPYKTEWFEALGCGENTVEFLANSHTNVSYLLDRLKEAEAALRAQNCNWRDDNHISENYFSKWEPKE